MTVHIIEKDSFTVIGKLGHGFAAESQNWIPSLWQEANSKFGEIQQLAKTDIEGHIVGIWGAMSDLYENFERWDEQGKYLAGCEVVDNSTAPSGWTKWVIPSYKYAVIKCNQNTYQEKLKYMLEEYLPNNNFSIVGAIHEYYNPREAEGDLYLFFPIERLI
ncbi:GyrI-like domain-containing protein [Cohnella sp.]|uniref:GyrI-like domain-containing protein n=1 Tax=Cohnella sp. TaxID=1883426 RepID=UPI00356947B6